ncbi:hydrogenase maturation protease [Hyperthermus butylicus]|uniref:Universally conserved protein n=1 Tax=Hyperthermus butylicus (strain DSM 5456 / JCM 9403 / PLM1-5) TaxID=415426 RepID=A2BMI6_HYPBU|nr:hydrogenase maturation protease [Hyperthermus butylicus]ABM81197.1 universally conserved protein [Hyperthermus butylicus DSM 5456]
MRLLVLGVGNPLFADDGLGYCVVRGLEECSSRPSCVEFEAVQALEPGLVALFEGRDHVVIIDIVDPRMLPPAAKLLVVELDPNRLSSSEITGAIVSTSSHELNPASLAVLARASGLFNGRVTVLGVPGFNIELGGRVSGEALQALPVLVRELSSRISRLCGEEIVVDMECFWRIVSRECSVSHGGAGASPG